MDLQKDWVQPGFNDSAWSDYLLDSKVTAYGDAVLRVRFTIGKGIPNDPLVADLGTFDDFDESYLNGILIGSTTPSNHEPESAWSTRRLYEISPSLLKEGENVLSIHVWNRNALSKGWKAWVRGPLEINSPEKGMIPYAGVYKHSDDPYLYRGW